MLRHNLTLSHMICIDLIEGKPENLGSFENYLRTKSFPDHVFEGAEQRAEQHFLPDPKSPLQAPRPSHTQFPRMPVSAEDYFVDPPEL